VKMTETPTAASTVILESTYGNRLHDPRGTEEKIIADICNEAIDKNSCVLMPAFSLERTQEFLHMFDHMKRKKLIPDNLPVYLDSPMGLRATTVFENYPNYFNEHMREHFMSDDPFDFPGLKLVVNSGESHRIDDSSGAKVIIAGSGMMTGGRIVGHAKKQLSDPATTIIFSGFQSPGTLGRQILDGAQSVLIDGLEIAVRAKVVEISTMSGHADQRQLLDWVSGISGVTKVILTHGEDVAREELSQKVQEEIGAEVFKPILGEKILV
jgi:metallo-beta-lactamase family protein